MSTPRCGRRWTRPGTGTHLCAHTRCGGLEAVKSSGCPPPHPVASRGTAPRPPRPTACQTDPGNPSTTPSTPHKDHPAREGVRTPRDPAAHRGRDPLPAPENAWSPPRWEPRLRTPHPLSPRPYRSYRSLRPSGSGPGAAALAAVMCRCRHGRTERIPRPEPDKEPFSAALGPAGPSASGDKGPARLAPAAPGTPRSGHPRGAGHRTLQRGRACGQDPLPAPPTLSALTSIGRRSPGSGAGATCAGPARLAPFPAGSQGLAHVSGVGTRRRGATAPGPATARARGAGAAAVTLAPPFLHRCLLGGLTRWAAVPPALPRAGALPAHTGRAPRSPPALLGGAVGQRQGTAGERGAGGEQAEVQEWLGSALGGPEPPPSTATSQGDTAHTHSQAPA